MKISLCLLLVLSPLARADEVPDAAKSARGLDSALNSLRAPTRDTKPLSPEEALKHFKLRPGYAIDLISAEPTVRQPLNINFDARGRMWVTQYVQYPFPAGLKVVEYDRYIRAKFDKAPLPPPRGDKGADRVTIYEDTDGDGTYDKTTVFVDGLNIATSALPGKDGVWVMNPPYLLFYPDANHDDVPDGDPVVHLSGFGLEDTHAAANSLTWGPDGWLYGAQGSTCTAKVKVEVPTEQKGTTDFLGQAIWRYHPTRHVFELFAEGGGNTFGVEFDDAGRIFSGTNFGRYRGVHYVQGGYYVKGWGKHGPLTNPNAFGFFDHMPHTGDATRLIHTFSVYGGGLMPELTGKIIGVNPLQSRVQVTRLEPVGSTFKTVEEEPPLLTTDDGWFRPVDIKTGPDGAIYVADFYENRISHVDPRDTWDRSNGRIWRVRPVGWKAGKAEDPTKATDQELVERLSDPDRFRRSTAMRLIVARDVRNAVPWLRQHAADGPAILLGSNLNLKERDLRVDYLEKRFGVNMSSESLARLWTLFALGGLDEETALKVLTEGPPSARAWCVRLLCDAKVALPPAVATKLGEMAKDEARPGVRSQLASSAKRLPAEQALPLIRAMLGRAGDDADPHIPLLLWWAIESKLATHRDHVVEMFKDRELWKSPVARDVVAPRLARWLAGRAASDAVGHGPQAGRLNGDSSADQGALLTLVNRAPTPADRDLLIAGVALAFEGRQIPKLDPDLAALLAKSGNAEIAARSGDKAALAALITSIADDGPAQKDKRIKSIEILGQVGPPEAAPALLKVALESKWHSVRRAALAALTHFNDDSVGHAIATKYDTLPADQGVRPAAISMLLARKAWAYDLLRSVADDTIPKGDVTPDQLDRLRQINDPAVAAMVQRVFGQPARATSARKEAEIARVKKALDAGVGDAKVGQALFTARCAACHTLFKLGGLVGPDLTGYERRNLDFLLISIVDPSAAIREEYTNFRVDTTDDQTFVGLIKERGPDSITLLDAAQQKTVVPKREIKDERALTLSIMPDGLLNGLSDSQLRDLFVYLQGAAPPAPK